MTRLQIEEMAERWGSDVGYWKGEAERLFEISEAAMKDRDDAEARADKLAERVKVLEEAVDEAIDTMRLVETPALPDPIHHSIVKELGLRIGFGALMSTASAGWIETAKEKGYPISGAFVACPCLGTVQMTLAKLRRARAAIGE